MTLQEIKEMLSKDDIINLLVDLGSAMPKTDNNGNLIFTTVCHDGDNHKLYYYHDSQTFHCYTDCGENFSIYDLIAKVKGIEFSDAVRQIKAYLGIETAYRNTFGLSTTKKIDDWSFINRYARYKKEKVSFEYEEYNSNIMDIFFNKHHQLWYEDGINIEAMKKYNIKFYLKQNKIIIPHYDKQGKLIGIRGRALNQEELDLKMKYMPIKIGDTQYVHNLSFNFYGLNFNKDYIEKVKKALIVESEKGVMQCETMFPNQNFTLATCGSNISNYQRNMLLDLGIEEVILGFDKQYRNEDEEAVYAKKILKLAKKFIPYFKTYILWDRDELLEYKDSPTDKGKETLLKLMKNKIELTMEVFDEDN